MAKKGKQWRHEGDYPSKGRDVYPSEGQTININVFVFAPLQNCKTAQSFVLSPHINVSQRQFMEWKKDKGNTHTMTQR